MGIMTLGFHLIRSTTVIVELLKVVVDTSGLLRTLLLLQQPQPEGIKASEIVPHQTHTSSNTRKHVLQTAARQKQEVIVCSVSLSPACPRANTLKLGIILRT